MYNIETKILNPDEIQNSTKMMVCVARLTQKGHSIKNMNDFMELYEKKYSNKTVSGMVNLPHPTIQKFGLINVAITGASRRFLAQITRHQNETKFMSASLQYSDYSDDADFVVPYEVIEDHYNNPLNQIDYYLSHCSAQMEKYKEMVSQGISNDAAGYLAPQGLRNILIISATPYQWKHMIGQRVCKRNTTETRYVMLKIWESLYNINPYIFSLTTTGPFCMRDNCEEGSKGCGIPISSDTTPSTIIANDFPLLMKE